MNKLEKYGVSVLVRTTDPNITEELVEQYFDLPHGFVKVISPVAGKMFKELYETVKPSGDCKVIHDGSVYTLLEVVCRRIPDNRQIQAFLRPSIYRRGHRNTCRRRYGVHLGTQSGGGASDNNVRPYLDGTCDFYTAV